jgi:hypothetical protein
VPAREQRAIGARATLARFLLCGRAEVLMLPAIHSKPWRALLLAAVLCACEMPDLRSDIVYYADHVPQLKNNGEPFSNPFTAQATAADPVTTGAIKAIAGLAYPAGTKGWGAAAWAKYAFMGNYDHKGSGVFQSIEDQRFGVYDSEKKVFCQLDLDPARVANASVQWISVAAPRERRSRIFFEGFVAGANGYGFGFVKGDLDNPDPCHPSTGWVRQGYGPNELNAAARASGQPDACPDGNPNNPPDNCGFDGMTVLHRNAATNTDTVVLSNWMSNRLIVAQIDGADRLSVPVVYVLPPLQPDDGIPTQPDRCYRLFPVGHAGVDATRPSSDLRFLQAFDKICAPADTPGCPSKAICPLENTSCTTGCANTYCSKPLLNSSYVAPPVPGAMCNGQPVSCGNYEFFGNCLDLGVATSACLRVHPDTSCDANGSLAARECTCTAEAPPTPVQEYSFNVGTRTLAPKSRFFLSAPREGMLVFAGGYTKPGDLFMAASERLANGSYRARILRYPRSNGERAFFDPSVTPASRDLRVYAPGAARDYPLKTGGVFGFLSLPVTAAEVGNSLMILSKDSLQREVFGFGTWTFMPQQTLSLGVGTPAEALPHESFACAPQSITACTEAAPCASGFTCAQGWCNPTPDVACRADSDCPSGQRCPLKRCAVSRKPCDSAAQCSSGERCVSAGALGEVFPQAVRLGGAPPSLWSTPHAGAGRGERARISAYLTRIPVAVDLPGQNKSQQAPALAWSTKSSCSAGKCDRLWLIAAPPDAPAGSLRYRTRDQGLWSPGWHALPSNVALAGGAAAVYSASSTALTDATIELYARGATGALLRSQLSSALDCAPGACTWSPWQAVPGSPVTDGEPSATVTLQEDVVTLFVAVKDRDGRLWLGERGASGWLPWRAIAGLLSDGPPSLVFKADDGQVWLFARDRSNGSIRYARVDGGSSGPWMTAGGAGAVLPWSTAPSASYTGSVRLLVGSGTFPSYTYQSQFSNGAWDAWKPITSGAGTTRRPATANVNGDLNVVTTYVDAMQEQLVK